MSAAIASGYAGVLRILADTADQAEPTGEDLLLELSIRMAAAAREVRVPSFDLKGAEVWGEWPESNEQH
jgi:hypothetical protein